MLWYVFLTLEPIFDGIGAVRLTLRQVAVSNSRGQPLPSVRPSATKAVDGAALTFQRIDDVHGLWE